MTMQCMLCVYMIRLLVYNVLNALYGYKCMLDVYIIRIVVYNVWLQVYARCGCVHTVQCSVWYVLLCTI